MLCSKQMEKQTSNNCCFFTFVQTTRLNICVQQLIFNIYFLGIRGGWGGWGQGIFVTAFKY